MFLRPVRPWINANILYLWNVLIIIYSGTHIAYQVVQSHGCSTMAGGSFFKQSYDVPTLVFKQL